MEAVQSVVLEGEEEVAPASPDRNLLGRRKRAYLCWLALGGIGTYVDKIHEAAGVVAYPAADWVGERFFVSPVYVGAGLLMFSVYTLVVGHHRGRQGLFGGRQLGAIDVAGALGLWMIAYQVSAVMGAPELTQTAWPYALAGGLVAWAVPPLWRGRRTRLPLYAVLVAIAGTSFEWFATSRGGFEYPVCPSDACLGATVPLVWLPALYLHAALFVHRMMGGTRAVRRALVHAAEQAVEQAQERLGSPPAPGR